MWQKLKPKTDIDRQYYNWLPKILVIGKWKSVLLTE